MTLLKNDPALAILFDILIKFIKETTVFRQLSVHDILWGEAACSLNPFTSVEFAVLLLRVTYLKILWTFTKFSFIHGLEVGFLL